MKKYFLINLLFLVSILTNAQKVTTVEGTFSNASSFSSVKLMDIENTEIDSSGIDDKGKFSLSATLSDANFYILSLDQEHTLILVLKPGEKVTIDADIDNFQHPKIKGSPDSDVLYSAIAEFDKYNQKFESYKEKMDEKLDAYQKEVDLEKQAYLTEHLKKNYNSLATLAVIGELDKEKDFDLYEKIMKSLKKEYPDNEIVDKFYDEYKSMTMLKVGAKVPEIIQTSPEGKEIKLSSLRGKVVLIDFWASWCRPCLVEAPHIVELYNKYKDKGFEIYGVSLDENKENWIAAIEKHKLDWVHVSDLGGWNNAGSKEYGVEGIPFTVLIDKEGNVIAKGLRSEGLKEKLEEIFE